ncbi:unnamed protein product [Gongylonema pulchrum]|uniref:Uncharacterized protein n=1 Tax=Gongylonema pulchrum TaxID=637853 RepID=A0A183DAI0_9BILA|nr:unnamed protein product [Gongylonema pulchrum]
MSGRRKATPVRLSETRETLLPARTIESMPSTSAASDTQTGSISGTILTSESTAPAKILQKQRIPDDVVKQELPREQGVMEMNSTSSPRRHADSSKSDASSISENTKFVFLDLSF